MCSIDILCLFDLISSGHFLQKHILSLDGPVVTAIGCKDQLAVVTHVSDCLPSNEQVGILSPWVLLSSDRQPKTSENLILCLSYMGYNILVIAFVPLYETSICKNTDR